ncbi:hypothetical protein HYT05_04720 [Candidatus Kaiserbacteria bacterium]|nr:hypothetical protein [Candidatus Kaiserbacteria bacterium]
MRTLLVLIFMLTASMSAYADASCLGYEQWSSVVTSDVQVKVKIWFVPQDGKKDSYVYVWYTYGDERDEGGYVRLDSGGYAPKIYEWLKSRDPASHVHARNLIEMYGMLQGVLQYGEELGD